MTTAERMRATDTVIVFPLNGIQCCNVADGVVNMYRFAGSVKYGTRETVYIGTARKDDNKRWFVVDKDDKPYAGRTFSSLGKLTKYVSVYRPNSLSLADVVVSAPITTRDASDVEESNQTKSEKDANRAVKLAGKNAAYLRVMPMSQLTGLVNALVATEIETPMLSAAREELTRRMAVLQETDN